MGWIDRAIETGENIANRGQGGFLNTVNEFLRGRSVNDLAQQLISIPLSFKKIFYILIAIFFFFQVINKIICILNSEPGEANEHKASLKNMFGFIIIVVPLIELILAMISWFTGMDIKW